MRAPARRTVGLVAALVVGLALAGCSDGEPGAPEPSGTTDEATEPALLQWRPVPGPLADEVTVSGPWTLTRTEDGGTVVLDGPDPRDFEVPRGYRFSEALIDGQYAVVVAEHEQATRANVVTVVDLASGAASDADVPPGGGGAWALGSGLLATTVAQGRDYCVAVADLVAQTSEVGPCVPPRHGLSNLTLSPAGLAAMSFDDGRPSCRTLNRVEGTELVPLPGVEDCRGWEAVVTENAAVWGVLPRERRIEEEELYTDSGSGPVELGPGASGTLTWCGDAAYVVRNPQRDADPARLLRIDPGGSTETVYESPGSGRAFLSAPRCGGTDLTLTAYSEAGDEQVTASLR